MGDLLALARVTRRATGLQVTGEIDLAAAFGDIHAVEHQCGIRDFVFTAYTVMVRVTVDNAANTRYSWNIVRNAFMQKLSLNFNARFNGEVTISRS
uniref:BON domain-containing protein n=1 Tax=Angiostrongylus cantonensis TaxID=6313 RepID=A0A0K0DN45_ANGCA